MTGAGARRLTFATMLVGLICLAGAAEARPSGQEVRPAQSEQRGRPAEPPSPGKLHEVPELDRASAGTAAVLLIGGLQLILARRRARAAAERNA